MSDSEATSPAFQNDQAQDTDEQSTCSTPEDKARNSVAAARASISTRTGYVCPNSSRSASSSDE